MRLVERVEQLTPQQRSTLAELLRQRAAEAPGEGHLVAYYSSLPGLELSPAELRQFVADSVPAAMVPSQFVRVDTLPRSPNGKLDRDRLPAASISAQPVETAQPRTRREQVLLAIWRETLGIDEFGIHENFFELGGHSLLSLKLVTEIRRRLNIEIPLTVVYTNPTIAELAAALDQDTETSWSSLVEVWPQGTQTPVFGLHCGKGSILYYYELAKACGMDQPIYALRPRGFDGLGPVDRTIEDMAAHYVEEIVRKEPTGPYRLCGFSSGGMVALEVAQQLRRLGKQVDKLFLLDTVILAQPKLANRAASHLQAARELSTYDASRYVLTRALGNLKTLGRRLAERTRAIPNWAVARVCRVLGRRLPPRLRTYNFYQIYAPAVRKYQAEPYDGEAVLFRPVEDTWFGGGQHDYGWGRLIDRLSVEEVPGGHGAILKEPHVHRLVGHLSGEAR